MKKTNTILLVAFLMIGTIGFVMAEESTNESTAQTIEPHKVGFFENAFDGFRFKFAFNKEKK
ncbi:MAG: hypothetical protein OEL87_02440, partial [Nanoarchaeota archaeon]|nr:hypothetical protein [Nanoarchaeota archaeon]